VLLDLSWAARHELQFHASRLQIDLCSFFLHRCTCRIFGPAVKISHCKTPPPLLLFTLDDTEGRSVALSCTDGFTIQYLVSRYIFMSADRCASRVRFLLSETLARWH
jgi:hypothetical protein